MRTGPEVEAGIVLIHDTVHTYVMEAVWVDDIAAEDALLEKTGEDVTIDVIVLRV